jgi:hypothetical protein
MGCHSVGLLDGGPNSASNAIGYAQFYSRSHDAVIRVYHAAGNVIESSLSGGFTNPNRNGGSSKLSPIYVFTVHDGESFCEPV